MTPLVHELMFRSTTTKVAAPCALMLAFGLVVSTEARALEMSGATTACHDPSRIIELNGTYYVYSTGGTINVRSSPDLVTWSWAAGVFSAIPSWMTAIGTSVGDTLDNIWAPDAILTANGSGGTHYLNYYSRDIGSGTTEHAVCGVATANSPAGPWTDQGAVLDVVVSSAFYRVIDPAPIVDQSGQLWIAVGSFGYASGDGLANGGIRVFPTNPSTGKLVTAGDQGTNIAGAWIEAPYIHYHSGYYYLFFNEGRCCNGLSSNYYVRIGRSTSINGAYTDLNGNSLRVPASGGTLFMGLDFAANFNGTADNSPTAKANKGNIGRELGPGHIGIGSLSDGIERVTYHFYDTATSNGEPTMGLKTILWGVNGWPRPGWSLPDGTYAIGTRLNADTGSSTPLWLDAASASPVLGAFTNSSSQYWNVTRVAANRHTITSSSSGLGLNGATSVSLDAANASTTTQRWFIEQTNDMSFKVLNNGSKTAALQVPSSASAAGTAAQLGSYGVNSSNQRWFITPVGGYRICSRHSSLCLQPSSAAAGASVAQQASSTNTLQYWSFIPTIDGYTRIVNASTGFALAVQGSSTSDGAAVIQEANSGASNQQFSVDVLTDSSMRFVPKVSGKALEVASASTTAGGTIAQNSWQHTLNQQFTITSVPIAAGGTTGTGGTPGSGGVTNISTGGSATGGNSSGGTSAGGTATGGKAAGGTSTGGTSASGTAIGGAATGGKALGGASLGGAATGGTVVGGASLGGAAAGGMVVGGASLGGAATGGIGTGSPSMGGNGTGGTGGSTTAGGASAPGAATGGIAGALDLTTEAGGCSCRTVRRGNSSSVLWLSVLGALMLRSRRRRG